MGRQFSVVRKHTLIAMSAISVGTGAFAVGDMSR
jgi:hypothetical protein